MNERDDCARIGRQEFWAMLRTIMEMNGIDYVEVKGNDTRYVKGVAISTDYLQSWQKGSGFYTYSPK